MALSLLDITEINEYRYYYEGSNYIPIFTLKANISDGTTKDVLSGSDAQTILSTRQCPLLFISQSDKSDYPSVSTPLSYADDHYVFRASAATSSGNPIYSYSLRINLTSGASSGTALYSDSGTIGYNSSTSVRNILPQAIIMRYLNDDNTPYADSVLTFSHSTAGVDISLFTQPTTEIVYFSYPSIQYTRAYCENVTTMLGLSKLYNPDNPFDNAGDPPEDPGQGEFDYDSDEIPIPDLPSVSVTSTGFVTLYTPSATELKNLANYLWSDLFSLDTFKKMFNNPMDCILGLTIVPLNLPTGAAQEITVGNIVTTVSCTTCPTQYVTVDCGSFIFSKSEFTASYLDYSPYTKLFLYLPYIGIQEINIDEFMGHTMSIVYHCDILTGALFCYVLRDDRIIYTYSGTCAENVPLSSNDFSTTIGSIMGAASAVAGTVATVATGGMAAPAVAGTIAKGVVSTASNVMGAKPSISHSGSLGGGSGIMGVQYPYLIFNAPRIATVDEQNSYTGFASNKIVKLSDLSGYNVIEAINLSVEGATDTECDEIKRILMEGVII